jgi:hypothetical protein
MERIPPRSAKDSLLDPSLSQERIFAWLKQPAAASWNWKFLPKK